MSTVLEIELALPQLTTEELRRVEEAVHQQYRQRHEVILYDDSYGVVTEADVVASADEVFLAYDQEEKKMRGEGLKEIGAPASGITAIGKF